MPDAVFRSGCLPIRIIYGGKKQKASLQTGGAVRRSHAEGDAEVIALAIEALLNAGLGLSST